MRIAVFTPYFRGVPLTALSTSESAGTSYLDRSYWLRYQEFFPGGLRITRDNAPEEDWWSWRGMRVHLDRVPRPEASAKLLALHGVGAYGRMLAPYSRLPSMAELEFLSPDLPGFGLTDTAWRTVTYSSWVECVLDLIEAERRTDSRPIVLLGVGAAGRLAYDIASRAEDSVAGVITTCLVDPRRGDVRRRLAARPGLGQWAGSLSLVPMPLWPIRMPVRWLVNIAAVSNQTQFANLVWADPLGGGNWISLSFVRTYLGSAPAVRPELFDGPPVLLVHPAEDRWTPALLSREFFDRVAAPKRLALLSGAGHLPVEESGLADLDRAVRDFLDELELR
jgi:alpha-beta hydrolase superfamily lysophospholipase